jgi:hypothetical protein
MTTLHFSQSPRKHEFLSTHGNRSGSMPANSHISLLNLGHIPTPPFLDKKITTCALGVGLYSATGTANAPRCRSEQQRKVAERVALLLGSAITVLILREGTLPHNLKGSLTRKGYNMMKEKLHSDAKKNQGSPLLMP